MMVRKIVSWHPSEVDPGSALARHIGRSWRSRDRQRMTRGRLSITADACEEGNCHWGGQCFGSEDRKQKCPEAHLGFATSFVPIQSSSPLRRLGCKPGDCLSDCFSH